LEKLENRVAPAVLTVNTATDETTADASLSLREAIGVVNTGSMTGLSSGEQHQISGSLGTSDQVVFDPALDGKTITLTGGELVLSAPVDLDASNLSNLTISGNQASRVFDIRSTTVFMENLTITQGDGRGAGALRTHGGGILIAGSNVTLSNCRVANNTATQGMGGGIANTANSNLTLNDCVIGGATAYVAGAGNGGNSSGGSSAAGLWNTGSSVTATDTVFSFNQLANAAVYGGGIYNQADAHFATTLQLTNCQITNNSGGVGGVGLMNDGATPIGQSAFALPVAKLLICLVDSNQAGASGVGGGILSTNAVMSLDHCSITNNTEIGFGGGIGIVGTSATNPSLLTVTSCDISGNSASTGGGRVSTQGGGVYAGNHTQLTMTSCNLSNNTTAQGAGGGIELLSDPNITDSLTSCTLAGNSALQGGAVDASLAAGSQLTLTNCTVVNNAATSGNGGGLDLHSAGSATLTNCTIASNSSTGGGAGIENGIDLTLENTIVAQNILPRGGFDLNSLGSTSSLTSGGGNYLGTLHTNGGLTGSDQRGSNPGLDMSTGPAPAANLKDNSGPAIGAPGHTLALQTVGLLPGSACINAGNNTGAPTTDERGLPRTSAVDATVDIGAFEFQPAAITGVSVPSSVTEGTATTLSGTLLDSNPQDNVTVTITWGDGQTTQAAYASAGAPVSFTLTHVYEESANAYVINLAASNAAGTTNANASVTVNDAPLTAGTLTPPAATEGQVFTNVAVFQFTDADPGAAVGDYTAVVALGDGNTLNLTSTGPVGTPPAGAGGQIVSDPNGGFAVQLSYTYLQEFANATFFVQVYDNGDGRTLSDPSDSTASPSPIPFSVADAPPTVSSANGSSFQEAEGTFTNGGTYSDYDENITSLTASQGMITRDYFGPGTWLWSDSGEEGISVPVTITATNADGTAASMGFTVTVTDAPLQGGNPTPPAAVEGQPFSNVKVLHFTDADVNRSLSDYIAVIALGDGNAVAVDAGGLVTAMALPVGIGGQIVPTNPSDLSQGFDVQLSYTYAEDLTNATFGVQVYDIGDGRNAADPSDGTTGPLMIPFSVGDAPLTAGVLTPPVAAAGQAFSNVAVLHFTDANPGAPVSDYTAQVGLGDGNTVSLTVGGVVDPAPAGAAGQIVADPNGGYDVQLSYTYASQLTNATFSVQVTDPGGSTTPLMSTAVFNVAGASGGNGTGSSGSGLSSGPIFDLPINPTSWTALGPAPIANGQDPGNGPVSGRITGLATDPNNANIMYAATAGGGVWKTTDGGQSWSPETDHLFTAAGQPLPEFMGAIAVAPTNSQIIYAGMGEANNNPDGFYGNGILVSIDGGQDWTLLGPSGGAVSRIAVDPQNPDIAYAAFANAPSKGSLAKTGIYKITIDPPPGATVLPSGVTGVNIPPGGGGSGYDPASPPIPSFAAGAGTGAAGTAIVNSAGQVTRVNITSPGTGYTGPFTVTFSGGGGAFGTATIGSFTWTKMFVTSGVTVSIPPGGGGSGYTSPPQVSFAAGAGSGAAGNATINGAGQVTGVSMTNAGNGYTGPFAVTFTGGGGSGAMGTASVGDDVTDAYSDVVIDPSNSDLYAAIGNPNGSPFNGVYKSMDGGATWDQLTTLSASTTSKSKVPIGVNMGRISLANAHPASASKATLYASIATPGSTVFALEKSVDGGASWGTLTPFRHDIGLGIVALGLGTGNPGLAALGSGIAAGGIPDDYMFSFAGSQGNYDNVVSIDSRNPNIAFVGGVLWSQGFPVLGFSGGGILETTDGGQNWTEINSGNNKGPHTDYHAMAFDANDQLIAGNDGGVWRLDLYQSFPNPNANGPVWDDLNSNLEITQFTGIALDPTDPNVAYGGSQDNGTEKFTGSFLQSWTRLADGDGGFVRVDPSDPQRVYHTFNYPFLPPALSDLNLFGAWPDFFQRSQDGGAHWENKRSGIPTNDNFNGYTPYVIDPSVDPNNPQRFLNPGRLLLGTNRLYETTNRGDGWQSIPLPSTGTSSNPGPGVNAIAIAASAPHTVYVSAGNNLFVTTDDGNPSDPFAWATPTTASPPVPAVTASESGTTVTLIFASNPPAVTGQKVVVAGFDIAGYNGTFLVTGVNGMNVTYQASVAGLGAPFVAGSAQFLALPSAGPFNGIYVDPTASGKAFVVVSANGSTGKVWETLDTGATWTDITGSGLPNVPINSVIQVPVAGLTIVGTDVGVYATSQPLGTTLTPSGGVYRANTQWFRLGGFSLPNVQVVDLETANYQGTQVLAAGTHGRGMWEIILPPPQTLSVSANYPPLVEGVDTHNYQVATFVDSTPGQTAKEFTATVSWGDGSPPDMLAPVDPASNMPGIVDNPDGSIALVDHHTYLEEANLQAGKGVPLTISITGADGSYFSDLQHAPFVNVYDAPLTLNAGDFTPPIAVEGQPLSNFTVCHFTDEDVNRALDDYYAVISPGNGAAFDVTPFGNAFGQIVATNPNDLSQGFDVQLSYTYAEEFTDTTLTANNFSVKVWDDGEGRMLADPTDSTINPSLSTFSVTDAPLTAGLFALTPPAAIPGQAFTSVPIFHFTDTDPNRALNDYLAVIDLGDGDQLQVNAQTGLVSRTGPNVPANLGGQIVATNPNDLSQGFDVQLSYTYASQLSNATFDVTVYDDADGRTIMDPSDSIASGSTGNFNLLVGPLHLAFAQQPPTHLFQGQEFTTEVDLVDANGVLDTADSTDSVRVQYTDFGTGSSGDLQQQGNDYPTAPLQGGRAFFNNVALPVAGPSLVVLAAFNNTFVASGTSISIDIDDFTPGNLQAAITRAQQPGGNPIVIDSPPADLNGFLSAANRLSYSPPNPVTITLLLTSGMYSGFTIHLPHNVNLAIDDLAGNQAIIMGHSPALTLLFGNVSVQGVMLTDSTAAPTILVKGGSLMLRDDTVETTGGGQAAVAVTGGTIDLGTSADPGGNVLAITGTGEFVHNTTGNQIPTVGDSFVLNGVGQPAELSFTSLSASNSTAVYGQAVMFMAALAANGPGTPTGAVDFFDASTNTDLGTAAVVNGVANLTATGLGVGTHRIVGNYPGDSNFTLSSDSLTISVVYNFPGFLSPIGTPKVAIGNLVPIWFKLFDANGNLLTNPADITSLLVAPVNVDGSLGTPFVPALYKSSQLGFERDHFTGSWITKGLIAGTYEILVGLNDGTVHAAKVQLVSQSKGGKAETAAGASGSGDNLDPSASLLFGDLNVYVNDPGGSFSADELARMEDAVTQLDGLLTPYHVAITLVGDPGSANLVVDANATSASGSAADGVLGCFNGSTREITMLPGWDWYAGSDPSQVGAGQYDFETTFLHELGHALGLGGNPDPNSPMNESLGTGAVRRTMTVSDLNLPSGFEGGADALRAIGYLSAVPALATAAGSAEMAFPFSTPEPRPASLPTPAAMRMPWLAGGHPAEWPILSRPVRILDGPRGKLGVTADAALKPGKAWFDTLSSKMLESLFLSEPPVLDEKALAAQLELPEAKSEDQTPLLKLWADAEVAIPGQTERPIIGELFGAAEARRGEMEAAGIIGEAATPVKGGAEVAVALIGVQGLYRVREVESRRMVVEGRDDQGARRPVGWRAE
jgi:hypothetical protein